MIFLGFRLLTRYEEFPVTNPASVRGWLVPVEVRFSPVDLAQG
jgi:hypothetical protein